MQETVVFPSLKTIRASFRALDTLGKRCWLTDCSSSYNVEYPISDALHITMPSLYIINGF